MVAVKEVEMYEPDEPRDTPSAEHSEPIDDTEGHSLLSAEFGASLARERDREAQKFARDEARRHEVATPRRGLRRFLGR